ncbi:hypothetical protein ACP70R_027029 [Stipagrostis hirtigluma subsp. patula]
MPRAPLQFINFAAGFGKHVVGDICATEAMLLSFESKCGDSHSHTKPGNMIRCSPQRVNKVISQLSERQKEFVRQIGFGSLLTVFFTPRRALTLWLVEKVNCETFSLDIKGTSIDIRSMVKKVLGLPSGGSKVPTPQEVTVPKTLKTKYTNFAGSRQEGLPINVAIAMLLKEEEEEPFKQLFTMVMLSVFLCPNTANYINREHLSAVVDCSAIRDMDWCRFIADYLENGIRDCKHGVRGCVYILVVLYIDFVKVHGPSAPFGYPRIAHITQDHHDLVLEQDKMLGKQFGKLPILAFSETAYAQEEVDTTCLFDRSCDGSNTKKSGLITSVVAIPHEPRSSSLGCTEVQILALPVTANSREEAEPDCLVQSNDISSSKENHSEDNFTVPGDSSLEEENSVERADEVISHTVDISTTVPRNSKRKIIAYDETVTKKLKDPLESGASSSEQTKVQTDLSKEALGTSPGTVVRSQSDHNGPMQSRLSQLPSSSRHQAGMVDVSANVVPSATNTSSLLFGLNEKLKTVKKQPQNPHFNTLREYPPEAREGISLGLWVTFANVEENIKKLHIDYGEHLFEGKLKSLSMLESNGFHVKELRARVENLLRLKRCQVESKKRKVEMESMKSEKEAVNGEIEQRVKVVDARIQELEKKLQQFRWEKELLVTEMTANESEISKLQADIDQADEACRATESKFASLTAGPVDD